VGRVKKSERRSIVSSEEDIMTLERKDEGPLFYTSKKPSRAEIPVSAAINSIWRKFNHNAINAPH